MIEMQASRKKNRVERANGKSFLVIAAGNKLLETVDTLTYVTSCVCFMIIAMDD